METAFSWSWIEAQVEKTAGIWKGRIAPLQPCCQYSHKEQRQRERAYDEGLRALEREAKRSARTGSECRVLQSRIVEAFARFSSAALDLSSEQVGLLTEDFLPVGVQLARWARNFDPKLGREEIVQACRNAWTACGMQPLFGERMSLTPSILGYSLLYPYSDNYLDREGVSTGEKLRFSERFRQRLRGDLAAAPDHREASISAMVALIEEQYPREQFPRVFECLLAIHRAQERSMAQLECRARLTDEDILRTTIAKGGSSVLADAVLVRGRLEEPEAQFAFEWGALLQLGDDLQDLRADLLRGSSTVFTRAARQGVAMDELVRQLLCFGESVVTRLNDLSSDTDALKDLLRISWRLLILGAVADEHKFFSVKFLREMEQFSPFRFDFLRARQRRISKQRGLYSRLFELFLLEGNGFTDGLLPSANLVLSFPKRTTQELLG